MMMNLEKSAKTCFAVGMVFLTTCAAAATTQFTKGKSWQSKNTYYPPQTQNAAPANPSGRTKLMAASKYNAADDCRVFDITISMYRERTEEERAAICDIITNFAAVVYEATDGKHKIGKVWVFDSRKANGCDIEWNEICPRDKAPSAGIYRFPCYDVIEEDAYGRRKEYSRCVTSFEIPGVINMYDKWRDKDFLANETDSLLGHYFYSGAVLAHEWSHAQYGLGDEYKGDVTYLHLDRSNDDYYQPDMYDVPVAWSLMNSRTDIWAKDIETLNYSICVVDSDSFTGHHSTGADASGLGKTAQYRMYGKSAWEQLKSPTWNEYKGYTSPSFEEFKNKDVTQDPTYELSSSENFVKAVSELDIIWAINLPEITYIDIDLSGSMNDSAVENVKNCAIEILSKIPDGSVVGIATFAGRDDDGQLQFYRIANMTAVTEENRESLKDAVKSIRAGSGNTALWDAAMEALADIEAYRPPTVKRASSKLLVAGSQTSKGGVISRNFSAASIILLTDGADNESIHDKGDVIARCNELGVAFNSIGYGNNADKNIGDASQSTGGHYYKADQDGNGLSEAFNRQFTYSAFRVTLADYSYSILSSQLISNSFYVDSSLTNVTMSVVSREYTDQDDVRFVDPSGAVHTGERTETSAGVTYVYRPDSCVVGKWTIQARVYAETSVSIYADADCVGDNMRVNGALIPEEAQAVVCINAMHSITGAQVTACVPCDGYIREVQFKENGLGCYSLDLVRCGPEAAKNGLTVRCDVRKGEAYVNYDDGLVSPVLDEGSESVKESKTRVIHFTADELKDLVGGIQASGSAEVNNVKASSRWPFDSKLDIDFTVACASEQPVFISVVGHDYDLNRELRATSLSGVDLSKPIASGTYRVTWDIARDYPEFHSKKFSVKVFSALEQVGSNASRGDNDSGVELVWTAASHGSISYEIWRSEQCDVATATLLATVKSGPYVDTTAIPGVLYYYWIRALGPDGAGEFGWPSVGYRDIAAPIGIQASDGTSSDGVEISWLPVDSATAYEVCRGTSDSCNPERVAVVSETCYVDTSATPGVDYYYWIRAKAPACTSRFGSNDLGWRKIVAPSNVLASDGTSEDGTVISWGGGVPEVRYAVYRSETSSISDAESIGCCEGSTFTDTSGQAGHAYYYWVRATVGNRMSEVAGPDRGWHTAKLSGNALYLVVDVTDGASASKYPFYEMDTIPGRKWSDEYKRTKIVLRRCPNGEFYMGSPSGETGRNSANENRHKVTLTKPFYIGVFEITQTQWTLVVGGNPSRRNGAERVQCPVEAAYDWIVPGKNAVSFVGLLRSKTGLSGFNLPTEAQWEYACRAGTTTAINTGKSLSSQYEDSNMSQAARYMYTDGDNGLTRYNRVGCYLPNNWGLYDMHGNVAEWCLDYYTDSLGTTAKTDPTGPTSGTMRVLRGGSYADYAKGCRSASRVGAASRVGNDSDEDYVGFRLFKSIP